MRTRHRAVALVAGAATTIATVLVLVPSAQAAVTPGSSAILVACSAPAWAEGTSYTVGAQVTYQGPLYRARSAHTPPPGAGWTPVAVPALWQDLGACDGGTPPPPAPQPPPP